MLEIFKKPLIIAIVGKGGTGKTVISTLITKALSNNYDYKLLLIDGDPTYPHFSKMVNINPKKSLETVKHNLIHNIKSGKFDSTDAAEIIDFEVYNALIETKRFSLFSIGQPEESGCFCPSNTIMKKVIESISKDFEIVLIDCEAGLEQINRMVIHSVDIVIIVSDESERSIDTALSIRASAEKFTQFKKIGLILNRFKGDVNRIKLKLQKSKLMLFTIIPEDEIISNYDAQGKAIIDIPEDAISYQAIKNNLLTILEYHN
jgi:CO dehydrogenase maturation factor